MTILEERCWEFENGRKEVGQRWVLDTYVHILRPLRVFLAGRRDRGTKGSGFCGVFGGPGFLLDEGTSSSNARIDTPNQIILDVVLMTGSMESARGGYGAFYYFFRGTFSRNTQLCSGINQNRV